MAGKTANIQRELRVVPGGLASASSPEPSDEEIIEAIERGDDRTAGRVYDRLIRVVDATVCRVLGRREPDHDDLIQSAFEQIIMTISRRRYVRACSLRSWAAAIATNVALNSLRARRRERRVVDRNQGLIEGDREFAATQDVEREVGARQAIDCLRGYLADMDADKALAVLLHDGFGYKLAEVAVLTGASVAAAQTRLVRGRRALLERASRDGGVDPGESGT